MFNLIYGDKGTRVKAKPTELDEVVFIANAVFTQEIKDAYTAS